MAKGEHNKVRIYQVINGKKILEKDFSKPHLNNTRIAKRYINRLAYTLGYEQPFKLN